MEKRKSLEAKWRMQFIQELSVLRHLTSYRAHLLSFRVKENGMANIATLRAYRHELVLADDPVAVRVERVELGSQRLGVHAELLFRICKGFFWKRFSQLV